MPWIEMCRANLALGQVDEAEKAIDQALKRDTRDIPALVLKGDCLLMRGDDRNAGTFYRAAIRTGSNAHALAPDVASELRRAEGCVLELQRRFEAHIDQRLTKAGFSGDLRSHEIGDAIDILLGRKRIFHSGDSEFVQEPTNFYYPGLPQRKFYERSEFDWMAGLESATDEIAAELEAIVGQPGAFSPYMVQHPGRPVNHHVLMDDPSWSAFYLIKAGQPVEGNAERCPRTLAALENVPLPRIRARGPNVLFSMLRPGAHIPAHCGMVNTQLICHLPIVTPPGCQLRVGEERRSWERGKALIFDDSVEHEAWNRSDQTRVVLLFDIWRPEVRQEERRALTTFFEAVEDYGA